MANHKQSGKRARQTIRRETRNTAIETRVKHSVRTLRTALEAGDKEASKTALKVATRELRRAATKGVLHKRTASRRVSRLSRAHNKLG
ncbi:MAG: 30S ribosomal protein S20 [Deltaproteobacteria bacterium RIFOXYA12_FULL_58_15]|nr:MAG: 30S ribosomal protein S20 [Deltaproteobacteria bacterium RIFOXYA12_FULL_58_15]OGR14928.1 MAG: 30S ribosomal protein S20 [Deltaproteobacteria bacterium RIFOXYB12_FULL_58_9]